MATAVAAFCADYPASMRSTTSTVSGNSTAGESSRGGGIAGFSCNADRQHRQRQQHDGEIWRRCRISGYVTLTNSTVSGNSTAGDYANGGGIYGTATLTNSTVSDNSRPATTAGSLALAAASRHYGDADQQHGQRQQHGR